MMQVDPVPECGGPALSRPSLWRTLAWVALALALLCGSAGRPALAAVAPMGTIFSTVLDLAGKQIPLPQGEWVLVGDGFEIMPSVLGGVGDAVESVVLFQLDGKAVSA